VRQLLRLLPLLGPVGDDGSPVPAADATLTDLAECAEASIRTIHLGQCALGQLVARCAMDLQDGSVASDSIESLGFLMAELGDLAAECMRICAECRLAAGSTQGVRLRGRPE
jgi:hypothetical protein